MYSISYAYQLILCTKIILDLLYKRGRMKKFIELPVEWLSGDCAALAVQWKWHQLRRCWSFRPQAPECGKEPSSGMIFQHQFDQQYRPSLQDWPSSWCFWARGPVPLDTALNSFETRSSHEMAKMRQPFGVWAKEPAEDGQCSIMNRFYKAEDKMFTLC